MSYSFNNNCFDCKKAPTCTDRAVINGAITGIHMMPTGVGHLGAGTVTLSCHNKQKEGGAEG